MIRPPSLRKTNNLTPRMLANANLISEGHQDFVRSDPFSKDFLRLRNLYSSTLAICFVGKEREQQDGRQPLRAIERSNRVYGVYDQKIACNCKSDMNSN
jgi:hypothetical protein